MSENRIPRAVRRAWFVAGVRRGDRQRLGSELVAEAQAAGTTVARLLEPEPADAARNWAAEQGLTDRRLRLAVLLPVQLLAGLFVAGALLVLLFQAFQNEGDTVLAYLSTPEVLAIYVGAGLVSSAAMLLATWLTLTVTRDVTRDRSVRALAVSVPIGGAVATATAVSIGASSNYSSTPETVWAEILSALAAVVLALVAGRAWAMWRPDPAPGVLRLSAQALHDQVG